MILLDPDLDPDSRPRGKRLKELPVRRGAGRVPHSGSAAASGKWRRSALLWAERLPTPATLSRFLREAQQAVRLRGEVSVLLTTDAAIRKLNRQFRGENKATDVLSFPAVDLFLVSRSRPGASANEMAGDLAISVDTALKQAAEQGHALACELKILMLHGLLHLAGYNHETDDGKMAKREGLLRARFGLPLGLIERAEESGASGAGGVSGARKKASQPVGKSAPSHLSRKKHGLIKIADESGPKLRPATGASRRESMRLAQGEAQRNPGKAPASRARRPVGPARKPAVARHRSPMP